MSQIINKIFLQKFKNKKGFTLIELLVVISIIGLLSTVVLSSVQKARTDAKWRAFERQLVEIRTAVQLYRTNNNGNWPNTFETDGAVLETLLEELKTAKVYPQDEIIPPQTGIDMAIMWGGKISDEFGNTGQISCGSSDYQNVYYAIYFGGVGSSLPTKIPVLYQSGVVYGSDYYYCIDFR